MSGAHVLLYNKIDQAFVWETGVVQSRKKLTTFFFVTSSRCVNVITLQGQIITMKALPHYDNSLCEHRMVGKKQQQQEPDTNAIVALKKSTTSHHRNTNNFVTCAHIKY